MPRGIPKNRTKPAGLTGTEGKTPRNALTIRCTTNAEGKEATLTWEELNRLIERAELAGPVTIQREIAHGTEKVMTAGAAG